MKTSLGEGQTEQAAQRSSAAAPVIAETNYGPAVNEWSRTDSVNTKYQAARPGKSVLDRAASGASISSRGVSDPPLSPLRKGFLLAPSPTFPISNRRCPKNPQSFTLTIVRTLRNAVKHAIAPTGLPFGVAAGGPSVGKATCDTLWRPSSPSRHAPLPWLPLITSDDPVDIRYPGAGWSPPIRSSTCRNTSLGTATSAS